MTNDKSPTKLPHFSCFLGGLPVTPDPRANNLPDCERLEGWSDAKPAFGVGLPIVTIYDPMIPLLHGGKFGNLFARSA